MRRKEVIDQIADAMDDSTHTHKESFGDITVTFPEIDTEGAAEAILPIVIDWITNWMDEVCPHIGGLEEQQMCKSDCPKCWVALKEGTEE